MKDDKKNVASVIISRMKKDGEVKDAPEQDGAKMDSPDDYDIAIDELMDAFEKKDKRALKDAMKSFVQMCMDESPEESSESEME